MLAGAAHSTTSFQAYSRAGTGKYFWCTINLTDDQVCKKYEAVRRTHSLDLLEPPTDPLCPFGCARSTNPDLHARRRCDDPGGQACRLQGQKVAERDHINAQRQSARRANCKALSKAPKSKEAPSQSIPKQTQQATPKQKRKRKLNVIQKDEDAKPSNIVQYVVEAIEGERKLRGKTEFLVKWKGFSRSENSWEPETNLDAAETIKAFRCVPK